MSNLNIEQKIYTIKLPVDPTYKVISFRKDKLIKELFIITGITEKEYHKLKYGDDIEITRGDQEFYITADDVFCFGDIDFHEGSDDSFELDTFNWLEHLVSQGIGIPSRYNYDKHECTSPINRYLITETFRNSTLCRYLHGCLGKPQFTLIFREIR